MREVMTGRIIFESMTKDFLWFFWKVKYFLLWVSLLVMSAYVPKFRLQFLITALIMGIRWATLSVSQHVHITVLKGGEKTWI
jgi:hypothetical protein